LVTINNDITQVKQFSKIFAQSNDETIQVLIKKILIHLNQQKEIILNFYIHYFKSNSIIGDKSVSQHPDLIVVLGCNRPSLDKRISYAIQIANQHPGAPILLSGGGFNIDMTEADYMHAQLKKAGKDVDWQFGWHKRYAYQDQDDYNLKQQLSLDAG
jgi:hypothetical protein